MRNNAVKLNEMPGTDRIRSGEIRYLDGIRRLLGQNALLVEDIDEASLVNFFIAVQDFCLLGCIALEPYGTDGLVRSLCLDSDYRSRGLGRDLLEKIEQRAGAQSINRLYLLTLDAAGYFARQGYEEIQRTEAPVKLRASSQFTGLCPDSAICMRKRLSAKA